ncbi:hypothetical protein HanPI659440_Chr15g0580311 [Helianthus annuus]|nr:hypothetical protein HanPI659440_Chr15g0580311 [Helianthus annuus]
MLTENHLLRQDRLHHRQLLSLDLSFLVGFSIFRRDLSIRRLYRLQDPYPQLHTVGK